MATIKQTSSQLMKIMLVLLLLSVAVSQLARHLDLMICQQIPEQDQLNQYSRPIPQLKRVGESVHSQQRSMNSIRACWSIPYC